MKKKILLILFSIVCIKPVFSQFDAQLSQYMLNRTAVNPAAAGESGMIDVAGQHRLQWIGMPNGGRITDFSITSPLRTGNINHAAGLGFNNYSIGLFKNQGVHVTYAYKIKLGKGILSAGTNIGFLSIGFSGDSVQSHSVTLGEYHDITADGDIPQTSVSGISFDVGIGAWYYTGSTWAGISYKHLNNPKVNWGETTQFRQNGIMYITAGTGYKWPETKFEIKPSVLFKSNFNTFQFDVSGILELDQKYWGGVTYRLEDAVVFLAGMNISAGLSAGYSYDLPTSKIILASSGSHEILLRYNFAYVFGKKSTKYKSIRIL